jgi:hypothetical protein
VQKEERRKKSMEGVWSARAREDTVVFSLSSLVPSLKR